MFHKERDYVVKLDFILFRVGETLPPVYKLFSSKTLDEGDLRRLFKSLHSVQVCTLQIIFKLKFKHIAGCGLVGIP